MAGPEIITLGCRLNIAESEAIRTMHADQDDLIVINSCAVTNEAVRQTRQAIRRAKRGRPDARVIVTGCAAQIDPDRFAAMPEVSLVLGNIEKLDLASYASSQRKLGSPFSFGHVERNEIPAFAGMTEEAGKTEEKVRVSDIMAVRETAPHLVHAFAEHARAFIEVQNGCDHRCTFCIIPFGRGNSRSVPLDQVVETVRSVVDQGYREVVLTGVDVTSYGQDLPDAPSLGHLVEGILRDVPTLPRLRLSSIDCIEIDDRLFDLITGETRVMPHLHLSLQSGDDMILKRMKRRHDSSAAVRLVERIKAKRPDVSIGADIIAGFPTETDAMFENSLKLAAECGVVHGHIFPFSPRAGTPAARMPQVDPSVSRARAARLRELCADQRRAWLTDMIGTEQNVLVERDGVTGHAENFAPVRFGSPQAPGTVVRAEIAALEQARLLAV